MKVPRYRSSKAQSKDAPPVANDALVMTGVEFLLSMVESRWASRNGDRGKTDPGDRTHKELEKVDQQIARLQDAAGQAHPAHSISAGLDYPGVGPEHSHLKNTGRATYVAVTDSEALQGFGTLARLEGIIPALESAHAVAWVTSNVDRWKRDDAVVICVSGRGDKDVAQVMQMNTLAP